MAEMTFWDHLDELRKVLFRVIGVWLVLAIGYFIAMPWLFDHVVLAPCHNDFVSYSFLRWIGDTLNLTDEFFTQEFDIKLVNINLAAPFFIHISTAFWMSVVTAVPYLFFEVWKFISPALFPNEQKGVRKALVFGSVMFFLGVLLGYFMVYPLALRFLSTYQLSADIVNQISLNSYIDNFMILILCMGLAFELPLVTWLLSLLGVVNKSFLRKYRRHAIVLNVILAAVITPTGDPFTLSVVAIPLCLLYEFSILMIKDKPKEEEETLRSKSLKKTGTDDRVAVLLMDIRPSGKPHTKGLIE
ncbi:MAG: twin-arginine translocase subunit TatC [Bacteroides sp.]|nr:twin-arginine translocase subunit TatC [Bacteroides sp.]